MRSFIAVDLPDAVKEALKQVQRRLGEGDPDVRWTAYGQLHLTLKFLGSISQDQKIRLEGALGKVAASARPFQMELAGLGGFPSGKAPSVVWAGVQSGAEEVVRLAASVEEAAAPLGAAPESRPFAAHVTLGRVRSSRNRAHLTRTLSAAHWKGPGPFRVDRIRLYQSELFPEGPRYTLLNEFFLGGTGKFGGHNT